MAHSTNVIVAARRDRPVMTTLTVAVAVLVSTSASGCGDREGASDATAPDDIQVGTSASIECSETPPIKSAAGHASVVHGWPRHPPGHGLGEATGVATDQHGHVFVFHRAHRVFDHPPPPGLISENTVVMFDADSGRQLAAWGAGRFSMPHGLDVDEHGNVWVTDVGLHQVLKFSHDGDLLQTFGVAGEPGNDGEHFNLPTDVVVLPDGTFYVSDGYANSRVVRFSAAGEYLDAWGTSGSGPGEFDLPHGIAWDGDATLYVADRGNRRIQAFTLDGTFKFAWSAEELGRPFGVDVAPSGDVVVIDGGDLPATGPDRSRVVVLSPEGEIRGTFGAFGSQDGQFRLGHDVAVGDDGTIYVVDTWGRRVQKFVGGTDRKSNP